MVKVTRMSNAGEQIRSDQLAPNSTQLNNESKTKKAPGDEQQKVIRVSLAQPNDRRRKTMPSLYKTPEPEVSQDSPRKETDVTPVKVRRQPMVRRLTISKEINQVVPYEQQRILSAPRESKLFEQSTERMFDTPEETTLSQQASAFPKWFYGLAIALVILGIAAIVASAIAVVVQASGIPTTNWLLNGDAESGACEAGTGFTHPLYWNYNGTATPIYYNTSNTGLLDTDPGPSNRGNCYFYGQQSTMTSMWQTLGLTATIGPPIIDRGKISYNLSAWMGGYAEQDDNVQVSLIFLDQNNQQVGNTVTLGPVLAAERANITSLIFHQTTGAIPSTTRSLMITVTMTLLSGTTNDGLIDNIALYLSYQ